MRAKNRLGMLLCLAFGACPALAEPQALPLSPG